MKSGINKILLPVSVNSNFESAVRYAFHLASLTKAGVTVLAIDDDSPWYETTLLPFHTKNLNPGEIHVEASSIPALNAQLELIHSISSDYEVGFNELIVQGHTATQILLVSRYHDIVVFSEKPVFADRMGTGPRRVDPILEFLDQTIIPTVLCGTEATPQVGPAAIYFDGSPNSAIALHQLAYLYQAAPKEKVVVRVSTFEEKIAKQLAKEAAGFLKTKGLKRVSIEYSSDPPIDFAKSNSDDDISLSVLGIRSRQAFHDFRIGELAHHFLDEEPGKNKMFC